MRWLVTSITVASLLACIGKPSDQDEGELLNGCIDAVDNDGDGDFDCDDSSCATSPDCEEDTDVEIEEYSLTFTGTGYDPHDGQLITAVVADDEGAVLPA